MMKVIFWLFAISLISSVKVRAQGQPAPSSTPPLMNAPQQNGEDDNDPSRNPPFGNPNGAGSEFPPEVIGDANGLAPRDPFRLPEELIIKIRQKGAQSNTGVIDPGIDAIRRFPLASYQLVGIIWEVKKPKAMFMDRLNKIHMVQVNDFIGNAQGVVTSIQSGSVTVLEGKIPQIIKLKK